MDDDFGGAVSDDEVEKALMAFRRFWAFLRAAAEVVAEVAAEAIG